MSVTKNGFETGVATGGVEADPIVAANGGTRESVETDPPAKKANDPNDSTWNRASTKVLPAGRLLRMRLGSSAGGCENYVFPTVSKVFGEPCNAVILFLAHAWGMLGNYCFPSFSPREHFQTDFGPYEHI